MARWFAWFRRSWCLTAVSTKQLQLCLLKSWLRKKEGQRLRPTIMALLGSFHLPLQSCLCPFHLLCSLRSWLLWATLGGLPSPGGFSQWDTPAGKWGAGEWDGIVSPWLPSCEAVGGVAMILYPRPGLLLEHSSLWVPVTSLLLSPQTSSW